MLDPTIFILIRIAQILLVQLNHDIPVDRRPVANVMHLDYRPLKLSRSRATEGRKFTTWKDHNYCSGKPNFTYTDSVRRQDQYDNDTALSYCWSVRANLMMITILKYQICFKICASYHIFSGAINQVGNWSHCWLPKGCVRSTWSGLSKSLFLWWIK